jgi:predicted nucleic acid-binding protein
MSYIFDSTPLIYLCKSGLCWIFKELNDECIIPESVCYEVIINGKEMGKADALIAEELVKKGIITVLQADRTFNTVKLDLELHQGEIDVLSLANGLHGLAIIDDDIARTSGQLLDVEVHGTIYLIFMMLRKGKLSKNDAKDKLNEMISNGFWMGHKQYLLILELIAEI